MLESRIVIDLPSEAIGGDGFVSWIRGLFGGDRHLSGREELTVGGLSLLGGIAGSFRGAEVTNIISLMVDRELVYLDRHDVPDDIDAMCVAAEHQGVLNRPFEQMWLAFTHDETELHIVIEVSIKNHVLLGQEEMEVRLAGRFKECDPRPGEDVATYVQRVREFACNRELEVNARKALGLVKRRLTNGLTSSLYGATVTPHATQLVIRRPTLNELGGFRYLKFGDIAPRVYRPQGQEFGKVDLVSTYYFDPYYSLASWVFIDAMLHHHALRGPNVRVIREDGELQFKGSEAAGFAGDWAGIRGVELVDGSLRVSAELPDPGRIVDPIG